MRKKYEKKFKIVSTDKAVEEISPVGSVCEADECLALQAHQRRVFTLGFGVGESMALNSRRQGIESGEVVGFLDHFLGHEGGKFTEDAVRVSLANLRRDLQVPGHLCTD